jgi:hypothetical protein
MQLYLVKLMISRLRDATSWTDSQTLNGYSLFTACSNRVAILEHERKCRVLSGPFLVSRTGDVG